MAELQYVLIKDVKPSHKNLNVLFIILEIGKAIKTKDNHDVRSCKVADRTGCINISVWDDPGEVLQTGDICRLVKGYSNVWKGSLTLYTGKMGEIHKIGEFCMTYADVPNFSEQNPDHLAKGVPQEPKQQSSDSNQSQRKSPSEKETGEGSGLANVSNPPPIHRNNHGGPMYGGPQHGGPRHTGPRGPPMENSYLGRGRGRK